jgi:hypothetical protein
VLPFFPHGACRWEISRRSVAADACACRHATGKGVSGAGKRARQPASGSRRLADVPHPEDLNFPAALWAQSNREAINRDTQEPVPHAPCVVIMVSVELRERRDHRSPTLSLSRVWHVACRHFPSRIDDNKHGAWCRQIVSPVMLGDRRCAMDLCETRVNVGFTWKGVRI